jgi:hypothetical protein
MGKGKFRSINISKRKGGFRVLMQDGKQKIAANITGSWQHARSIAQDLTNSYGLYFDLPAELPTKFSAKFRGSFEYRGVQSDNLGQSFRHEDF